MRIALTEAALLGFRRFAASCPHLLELSTPRRQPDQINSGCGIALPRCKLRVPASWPKEVAPVRWLARGGTPLVFGVCSPSCALGHRWCSCGHRVEHHEGGRCLVVGCGCSGP